MMIDQISIAKVKLYRTSKVDKSEHPHPENRN